MNGDVLLAIEAFATRLVPVPGAELHVAETAESRIAPRMTPAQPFFTPAAATVAMRRYWTEVTATTRTPRCPGLLRWT